jgi:hypothetical protein
MMVLVLAAGCGGSDSSQDEGGATPTDTSSPNDGGPTTTGGNDGNGDGNGSDEGIAWVPFGPNDPKVPTPGWPAYKAFAGGKCSALRRYLDGDRFGQTDYGKAMLAVCRAAIDGNKKQWAVAEDLAGANPGDLGDDCLAPLISGAMDRAIAWHKKHPGKKPTVRIQRESDGITDCGQKQYDEESPPTDEPTTDESSPTPDETPTSGETTESTG